MSLRFRIGRLLPTSAKRTLRRVLPARLVDPVRRFSLEMPVPPIGLSVAVRGAAIPARIRVKAPARYYVPRLLEEHGAGGYELETMAAFLAAISFGDAAEVFDVGANVGVFSFVAAATTLARVTGFEPEAELAATFRSIAADNRLTCEVERIALGAQTGTATLFLSATTDSSNSLRAGIRPASGTVEVPLERLDDYVARTGRRPTVLKIDTETTEPDVIAGGIETLRAARPWIVCEVLPGKTETPLTEMLRPLGYRFHHLDADGSLVEMDEIRGDATYLQRDWLFTPEPLGESFAAHYTAWREALRATVRTEATSRDRLRAEVGTAAMSRARTTEWVTAYERAWRRSGTDHLGELFSPDIAYRPSPWAEAIHGLDALGSFWERERESADEPFDMTSEVVAADGHTAVVRVGVTYHADGTRWRDLWVIELGPDGRCRSFEEWPFAPDQTV